VRRQSPLLALPHALLAVALVAATGPAAAHSPIPGIGVFYSGVLHPFIAPALLLSLVALGLHLGQGSQGDVARVRVPLLAYAFALLAGLVLHAWTGEIDTDRLLLVCGALAGVVTAAAWAPPIWSSALLAGVIGLAVGVASTPSGVEGRAYAGMLAGTVIASIFLPLWVTVVVSFFHRAWLHIAARVLGSWMAAAAVLVLSLSFAPAVRG
jgi:urease accessory protein